MEYKVRKESQTCKFKKTCLPFRFDFVFSTFSLLFSLLFPVMEKVFNSYERRGLVRSYQLGPMLRALNPELNPTEEELRQRFLEHDSDRDGALDFESFHELALQYLLQQTRRESDGFAHKHLIRLADFQ